jgi:hemolysin activation/secretion protein
MVSRDRLAYRSQQPEDRRDKVTIVSAGIGYRFSPALRAGVDLEFARRLSDRADRDYDRVRLLGSAAYGF